MSSRVFSELSGIRRRKLEGSGRIAFSRRSTVDVRVLGKGLRPEEISNKTHFYQIHNSGQNKNRAFAFPNQYENVLWIIFY